MLILCSPFFFAVAFQNDIYLVFVLYVVTGKQQDMKENNVKLIYVRHVLFLSFLFLFFSSIHEEGDHLY